MIKRRRKEKEANYNDDYDDGGAGRAGDGMVMAITK